jgi:membrane protein
VFEIGRFLIFLFKRFEANQNRKSAAALTFVTLFAIVPLMTAGYGMLTIFPQFSGFLEQFHQFAFENFFPAGSGDIERVLTGFAVQAKNLTFVGLVLLLVSAISLMFTIEDAFNTIWRVTRKRIGRRLIAYWLVILLGPILLAVGFLISSYLLSSRLWVEHVESVFHLGDLLIRYLPLLLSVCAFSLMYYFLPSCKVRFVHAIGGGVITACLLEVGKIAFVAFLAKIPSYQVVYGAFAAVPLFLIWIFMTWCMVLLGAEIVRVIPFIQKYWAGGNASQLDWALFILKRLNESKMKRLSREELASSLPLYNADQWEAALAILAAKGWVADDLEEYVLSADLNVRTVGELSELIDEKPMEKLGVVSQTSPWFEQLSPLLIELQQHKKATLGLPIAKVVSE